MEKCPCGSDREFSACCEPFLKGAVKAPTAEALMRSRYTAYVKKNIPYIVETCVRKGEKDIDTEETRRWSEESTWFGLSILKTEAGSASDTTGIVEFVAAYSRNNVREDHHEIASFVKNDSVWLYDEGKIVPTTITRSAPKVGRNEPCPCGSGKKYKQCCGKAS
jgi:SEC-C motif domain protein